MATTRGRQTSDAVDVDLWTRRRVRCALLMVGLTGAALVAGTVWSLMAVIGAVDEDDERRADPDRVGDATPSGLSARDELAERPLPVAPLESSRPGPLSAGTSRDFLVPPPTHVGAAGVATGFPPTPEGALAQLAAINDAALSSGSVRAAQEVIAGWARLGGPTTSSWSGVRAVATLLAAAGTAEDGTLSIETDAAMGFIKGTVGDDYVVPCIDFIVTVTAVNAARKQVATADCQRMEWVDHPSSAAGEDGAGRWMISSGAEPSPAPSLWPGTQASFDAGYRWLETAP